MASQMESAAIRERLAKENPSVTEFHSDLASSLDMIGSLHRRAGKAQRHSRRPSRPC